MNRIKGAATIGKKTLWYGIRPVVITVAAMISAILIRYCTSVEATIDVGNSSSGKITRLT